MVTSLELPLLPPLQCQQPHFGFKHQVIGSCGSRRGRGRDGPSPGLTAESTQLRDKTPHGGPWPGLHTRSSLNPLCIFGQMTLYLHIISQHFPSPWDTEQWWLIMEHCSALTLSMKRRSVSLQITPFLLEAWNYRNKKSFPEISLHSVCFNDSIFWPPYGPPNKLKTNDLKLSAVVCAKIQDYFSC